MQDGSQGGHRRVVGSEQPWGDDAEGLMGDGMGEGELMVLQGDGSWLPWDAGAVAGIPHNRTADVRQLGADLMVAAAVQTDLQDDALTGLLQGLVIQNSLLGSWYRRIYDFCAKIIMAKPMLQPTLRGRRGLRHHRQIQLDKLPCAGGGIEAAHGLAGPSEEHHAGDGAVQSMNRLKEDAACLSAAFLDPGLRSGFQTVLIRA